MTTNRSPAMSFFALASSAAAGGVTNIPQARRSATTVRSTAPKPAKPPAASGFSHLQSLNDQDAAVMREIIGAQVPRTRAAIAASWDAAFARSRGMHRPAASTKIQRGWDVVFARVAAEGDGAGKGQNPTIQKGWDAAFAQDRSQTQNKR